MCYHFTSYYCPGWYSVKARERYRDRAHIDAVGRFFFLDECEVHGVEGLGTSSYMYN